MFSEKMYVTRHVDPYPCSLKVYSHYATVKFESGTVKIMVAFIHEGLKRKSQRKNYDNKKNSFSLGMNGALL